MSAPASGTDGLRRQGPLRGTTADAYGLIAWAWPALVLCLLVIVIALPLGGGSGQLHQTILDSLINLTVVVGMYVFIGNSGVISFGHVGFVALGAYTSALLTIPVEIKHSLLPALPHFLAVAQFGPMPAALIGGAVATLVALVAATALMRLNGLAAGIATFSLLIIVNVVAGNWTAVTRGQESMIGVPLDLTLSEGLICACGAIVIAYVFQESRIGLRLRASREDEIAARSIGIGVVRERTIAFTLSAFPAGIAGALYGHYLGSFGASSFYLDLTFLTFVMLVVGGISSLSGAVVGSVVISAVSSSLTTLQVGANVGPVHITLPVGTEQIVLALFFLAVLILRPAGITGGREIRWPFTDRGRSRIPSGAATTGPSSVGQ